MKYVLKKGDLYVSDRSDRGGVWTASSAEAKTFDYDWQASDWRDRYHNSLGDSEVAEYVDASAQEKKLEEIHEMLTAICSHLGVRR